MSEDRPTHAPDAPEEPGHRHLHARLDHHAERLVRLEAHREHDRDHIDSLRQGLVDADAKIERRFGELEQQVGNIQRIVNKTFWLVVGGFTVITTGGVLLLWALRVSNGIAHLVGGN